MARSPSPKPQSIEGLRGLLALLVCVVTSG
jgi:hypothetical protein